MLRAALNKILDAISHLAATHPMHEATVERFNIANLPFVTQVWLSTAVLLFAYLLKYLFRKMGPPGGKR